ncbi:MAG: hypothetical protein NTZ48_05590 [Candidatus Omnitrophica bacterium]|nr:hypothetical protein [Candidatus Omnitrophota bacterium]
MQDDRTIYEFGCWTGNGYREIDHWSIKVYPIKVKALTDKEAIQLFHKKRAGVSHHNTCYQFREREKLTIPVRKTIGKLEVMGLFFNQIEELLWEGQFLYWGGATFITDYTMQRSIIMPAKYNLHDTEWICRYCASRYFPSYVAYYTYVWGYMGVWDLEGNINKWTTSNNVLCDLKKYMFDSIDKVILLPDFPVEETEALLALKIHCQNIANTVPQR